MPTSCLESERKIAHYVHHRDAIIKDDDEAHHDRMEDNHLQRELNRHTREEALKVLDVEKVNTRLQRDYDQKIAVETNETALAQAQWQTARARWGRDAFEQSMPFRKERIEHLYKTGTLDAEIERLISEGSRDKQRVDNAPKLARPAPGEGSTQMIEQLLAELDQEIETAHATHASDDHKAALYAMRARLSAKLAALKGQ